MLRIIVTGSKGRMGSRICALVKEAADLELAAGIDMDGSLEDALRNNADVVVDFTVAAAAAANAAIAAKARVPIVIGTTGMNEGQQAAITEASRAIPIVQSSNMGIGVNVMWKLIERAASALGSNYAIAIEETHHVHKLDKPSGTAKTMAQIAARSRECDPSAISVQSFRQGEVVGDHSISFTGPAERLTIQHHAENRDLFAQGALAAARWIIGRPAGLYTMQDVLGL